MADKTKEVQLWSADGMNKITDLSIERVERTINGETWFSVPPVIRWDSGIYHWDEELECYLKSEIVDVGF